MNQIQVSRAYQALSRLSKMPLPIREARKIFMLSKKVELEVECGAEMERKLIEKYKGEIRKDGTYFIPVKENQRLFIDELEQLSTAEIETKFEPVTISIDSIGDGKMMPVDFDYLEGLVSFE